MNILYIRTSSISQNSDRQKINQKDFDIVVEDKCSGSIAFAEREGGKKILALLSKKSITTLSVLSIDRLGRNLMDLLKTIELFNQKCTPIIFVNQGLRTLDVDGRENAISKMMISILGTVSEMERVQIKERQREGIIIAKAKGVFLGRKKGTSEDNLKFLSKTKNVKALEYMKMGTLSNLEISKLADLHINTLTKIRRLGLER
ncbi:MAG: recombinase family protein [Bacteroidota bacterium]